MESVDGIFRRRSIALGSSVLAVSLVVYFGLANGISRQTPLPPQIDSATVAQDTVRRGEMLRQVRGQGTIVEGKFVHVATPSAGEVMRVNSAPGRAISRDTILIELRNLEIEQQAQDATLNLQAADAELANLRAQLQSQNIVQRADLASLQSHYRDTKLKNDRDQVLYEQGLLLQLDYRLSANAVADLVASIEFQEEKGKALAKSLEAQLISKDIVTRQIRQTLSIRRAQLAALKVRSGMSGTVERVLIAVGQQVSPGTDLAVIFQPQELKVALVIPANQAREVRPGQPVRIETSQGAVAGRVTRVEPSAVNGARTVDIKPTGILPAGSVAGQSVDGVIEIERLNDVVYMNRPLGARPGSTVSMFKILPNSKEAVRVNVKLGRNTAGTIEILTGLKPGDRIITADLSAFRGSERLRLR